MKLVKELEKSRLDNEISDNEAEEAFIKILKYIQNLNLNFKK